MFDIQVVNAFSTATVNILKNYCNAVVHKGELRISHSIEPIEGVGIFVWITGDIDGRILATMHRDTAFRLVSVMNEELIESLDDIFIGTAKEFLNTVAGVAINELSTKGINLNLTTPTIMIGQHMTLLEKTTSHILHIEYQTNIGEINLSQIFSNDHVAH